MLISYNWLKEYIDGDLPEPDALAQLLTMHAYEVEEVREIDGDIVFDIDVLPNRAADSLSHWGVAREVAALSDKNLVLPKPESETEEALQSREYIDLSVKSGNVRRATKRIVMDVAVGETPQFIKDRLASLGQRSHNNVVDITNYVMNECGQPVHAFDYDKLAGEAPKKIVVRAAEEGETVTTLDGDTYELSAGMVVIADGEKPLDIAGIKGGNNSGIDEDTTRVVLSVCSFNPTQIRKTSQALNLRTDASKRFENNINQEMPAVAMERLSQLLSEHAGARVAEDILDEYPRPHQPYTVGLSLERTNRLLGTDFSEKDISQLLEHLEFSSEIVETKAQVVKRSREYVGVPYVYGASVLHDAPDSFDCSSFISFLYVQAGVQVPRDSSDQYVFSEEISEDELEPGDLIFSNSQDGNIHHSSNTFMAGLEIPEGVDHVGMYLGDGDVIHASRYNEGGVAVEKLAESEQFKNIVRYGRVIEERERRFVITVPYFRQDIRREVDVIEEIGRINGYESIEPTVPDPVQTPEVHKTFYYTQKIRDILVDAGFSEVYTYAFQKDGEIAVTNPIADDKKYLRANLADGLSAAVEHNQKHSALLDSDTIQLFEIGKVFSANEETLMLGIASDGPEDVVTKALARIREELDSDITHTRHGDVAEIPLDEMIEALPTPDSYDDLSKLSGDVVYQPFSRFPYALRDVAVWVPDAVAQDDVEGLIQKTAGDLLVTLKLFDTYNPDDQNRTSFAFRLVFQSDEKTLSDVEVNEIMERVYTKLDEGEGWETR